jgi:uncharacterized protein (TIGR02147 family)
MVNILDYIDYRRYLRDAYEERRKENPKFSYRFIAGKVGFSSPGFFANVLSGKKDISLKLALKFAELFRLGRKEKEYFETLVLFNKADGGSEKKEYLDRLLALRGARVKKVETHQWEYFEKWHHAVIRELISIKRFRGNYRALAAMVNPPITPQEARKSVELLERLDLVRKASDGAYERTDSAISAGDAISRALIGAYQVQAMDLAKYAMDHMPSGTRNFSTLTMSVSAQTYEAMLEELRAFRRRLLEMAQDSDNVDRVYQMNFHVFPLSALPAPSPARNPPLSADAGDSG